MLKGFFLYGLSAGLNRAGIFLLLPLSAMYISPKDFGDLNLYLISSSLLSVVLTLNISSIISREYYNDKIGVMNYINLCNVVMFSLLFLLMFFFPFFYNDVVFLLFAFFISECLFLVNSNYIRFKSGSGGYFKLTIVKFLVLVFSFYICSVGFNFRDEYLVRAILVIIFISNVSFLLVDFDFRTIIKPMKSVKRIDFKNLKSTYLIFALTLIPHSAAQWISSSFDRFFVKWFFTANELGIYSFSYSVASILLLVSSSYALGLPQLCVKNFKLVGSRSFFRNFFLANSILLWFFLYTIKMILPYFPEYNDSDVFNFVVLVSCGLYFLFFYLYFSSCLFYERRGQLISKITLFVCVYSVCALYPFAYYLGIVGVCIVTLSAYFLYMCLVGCYSVFANLKRVFLPIAFSFFTISFFIVG